MNYISIPCGTLDLFAVIILLGIAVLMYRASYYYAQINKVPTRKWATLDYEEIDNEAIKMGYNVHPDSFAMGAHWAEARLKELNR